jgi:Protein of unknown function (DUF3071)
MQELRLVAVSEDGSYAVLVVPGRGGRFTLQIDDRLRAVARGQFSRLAQYEIEVESPLRPKEIQERIRAGETADEIADAAGVPIERVRWFEGPVLAERAYKAQEAQAAMVRRPGDSGPGPTLGEVVTERLTALGTSTDDAHWDSVKLNDGNWQVQLLYSANGRARTAEWVYDPRRRHATPDGDAAARLSLPESDLPPDPDEDRAGATVTPLQPRFATPGSQSARAARQASEPAPRRVPEQTSRPQDEPSRAVRPETASHPSTRGRAAQKPRRVPEPVRSAPEPSPKPAPPAERAAAKRVPDAERVPAAQDRPRQAVPEETENGSEAKPAAHNEPAQAEQAQAERAQSGRRAAGGRGRRASMPSWDEIMFGSSRPRE